MNLASRTGTWAKSGAPLPYREVDYVESLSSGAYFQTDIYPSADFSYHGKFLVDLVRNADIITTVGCGWGSNGSAFILGMQPWHATTVETAEISSRFVWTSKSILSGLNFGNNELEIFASTDSDGLHERMIANGTDEGVAEFPVYIPSKEDRIMPIRFLACGADALYVNSLGSRIIGRHIIHSGSVDAEFVPVDDGSGNGCLYEINSNTLLAPAAGSFAVGPY